MDVTLLIGSILYLLFATRTCIGVYKTPAIKITNRPFRLVLSILFGLVWPVVLVIPYVIGFLALLPKKKSTK